MRKILFIFILFASSCSAQQPKLYKTTPQGKVEFSAAEYAQWNIDNSNRSKDSILDAKNKAFRLVHFNNAKRLKGADATGLSITDMRDLFVLWLDEKGAIDTAGKVRDLKDWIK